MWIFTPDVAYNSDAYMSIWAMGGSDANLYLQPKNGDEPDCIVFDSPLSAVRAFDAVMNGLSNNVRTVFVKEVYSCGNIRLDVEYDTPYHSVIEKKDGEYEIADPRVDVIAMASCGLLS